MADETSTMPDQLEQGELQTGTCGSVLRLPSQNTAAAAMICFNFRADLSKPSRFASFLRRRTRFLSKASFGNQVDFMV